MRLLPELTPFNEWFWTSGADGARVTNLISPPSAPAP